MVDVLKSLKNEALPESLRPLFWSYDFSRLNPEKNKKNIILQVINYGNLKQWRWLTQQYGMVILKDVLSTVPIYEIKPRTRKLASILFSINHFNYALRSAHR